MKPTEESIACYLYGYARNSGICFFDQRLDMGPDERRMRYARSMKIYLRKLSDSYLTSLSYLDLDEIGFEIEWSLMLEKWTHKFWHLCDDLREKEFSSVASRYFTVRPFSEEMHISYLMGLSWAMKDTQVNRQITIRDFLLKAKGFVAPNIDRERIFELWEFYSSDNRIDEFKLLCFDVFQITAIVVQSNSPLLESVFHPRLDLHKHQIQYVYV